MDTADHERIKKLAKEHGDMSVSEFIRRALLERAATACPACNGTGTIPGGGDKIIALESGKKGDTINVLAGSLIPKKPF